MDFCLVTLLILCVVGDVLDNIVLGTTLQAKETVLKYRLCEYYI